MAKGRKTGGRQKGTPNKSTGAVREAIAVFAEANVGKMDKWLAAVASTDPAKALELYLRAIEYHIPKLGRTEVTGEDGGPVEFVVRDLGREKPDGE